MEILTPDGRVLSKDCPYCGRMMSVDESARGACRDCAPDERDTAPIPTGKTAAPRPCTFPCCKNLVVGGGRCVVHLVKEADRPNADIRTWYRTPRWRALRAVVLRDQPFCPDCAADHRRVLTTDVDHIEKHHGDPQLFWNRQNLQAKCHAHHSAKTGRGE